MSLVPPIASSAPQAPTHPTLRLSLLGNPRWQTGTGQAALSRIDAAWLALVALGGSSREAPRDRLAAWLWPEVPLRSANTNLRQRLFKLRQASGHPVVEAGALWRLETSVAVDLLAPGCPDEGELLGGLDFGDLAELDRWIGQQREALSLRRADHLLATAARLEADGALAAAIGCTERVVVLAPVLEHGWRRLMRLHYLRGDRAAAVTAFERFEQQVCRELGLRPSDETLALLRTVEQGAGVSPPLHGPLAASLVRPPRLVGRDGAWRAVQAAWQGGRAALVLGEGGIGKSRLLADLLAAHRALPGAPLALETRARPGDGAMPYASVTPLLEQALAARPVSVDTLPAAARRELARLLPALGEPPAGAARQALLWQAVESLLADGPATLALDDLHHADTASLELLRWLLASPRLGSLRWLLAARPDEPEPASALLRQWLGDSSRIEPVRLAALTVEDVDLLLQTLALPVRPGQQAPGAAELHRHAGGNPFFTLETLKSLVLEPPTGVPMPLPASAAAMLQRRIDRLSAAARQLLQAVVLAPGAVDAGGAASVLGPQAGDASAAWAELESAQLLREAHPAHDLVREQVLAAWPAPARSSLAATLARHLSAAAGRRPLPASRMAQLWLEAQDGPQAARCLVQAATEAARAGRLPEQRRLLEHAASLWQDAADGGGPQGARDAATDARLQAAHATLLVDGSAAAQAVAEGLQAQVRTPAQRASLALLRANASLNEARFADALQAVEQALRLAPPGSPMAREASLLHARALALTGRATEALPPLRAAADAALQCGDPTLALDACGSLAHALQVTGRYGEAVDTQQRATDAARALADPVALAQNLCNLASLQSLAGQAHQAWSHARQADAQFARLGIGDAHRVYNGITWARCAAHLGHLDEALQALPAGDALDALPASVGLSMATMVRVIRHGIDTWLGATEPRALPEPDGAGWEHLSPLARAGLLLAHLRGTGGERQAALARRLQQLAHEHPALRQDPVLMREWCRLGDPLDDVAQLAALERQCRAVGAPGLACSLALVRVDRLAHIDPQDAATLAAALWDELQPGTAMPQPALHPATHLPTAWSSLARAFAATGDVRAEAARAQAARWLAEARLPAGHPRELLRRDLSAPA